MSEQESLTQELLEMIRQFNTPPELPPMPPYEAQITLGESADSVNPAVNLPAVGSTSDEEPTEKYPPWVPWAVVAGVGVWGLSRKPK